MNVTPGYEHGIGVLVGRQAPHRLTIRSEEYGGGAWKPFLIRKVGPVVNHRYAEVEKLGKGGQWHGDVSGPNYDQPRCSRQHLKKHVKVAFLSPN
jgi:hypothetical protein